jgi:hypothetical protein
VREHDAEDFGGLDRPPDSFQDRLTDSDLGIIDPKEMPCSIRASRRRDGNSLSADECETKTSWAEQLTRVETIQSSES